MSPLRDRPVFVDPAPALETKSSASSRPRCRAAAGRQGAARLPVETARSSTAGCGRDPWRCGRYGRGVVGLTEGADLAGSAFLRSGASLIGPAPCRRRWGRSVPQASHRDLRADSRSVAAQPQMDRSQASPPEPAHRHEAQPQAGCSHRFIQDTQPGRLGHPCRDAGGGGRVGHRR